MSSAMTGGGRASPSCSCARTPRGASSPFAAAPRAIWRSRFSCPSSCAKWRGICRALASRSANLPQHYHPGLVAASIVVAILASYTALTLAVQLRGASGRAAWMWLLGGGFAMGIGIWSMHFVGMLALTLAIALSYDGWITASSMLIAIVVSTFALHIASREQLSRPRLIAAGV